MWVWRLAKARYARQLDGEGNRRTGARWNSPGRSVVYTSEVLSLAVLEMLVHTTAERLPKDLMAVAIEIPNHLPAREIALSDFPPGREIALSDFPPGRESGQHDEWFRHTGDSWLSTAVELCLIAPS